MNLINVYSGPEHFVKAENRDEFYVVTIAYYTKGYKGTFHIDTSESIKFDFFYPDQVPYNIVKSHRTILDEFLAKHYAYDR